MSFYTTTSIIILGLLSISSIVIIHEFGHYIFARLFSVRVHEFAIGFGPALFKKQGNHCLFSIRILPLGGFCKLESVDLSKLSQLSKNEMSEPVPYIPNSLYSVSYLKRVIILLGGALANILFFALLFVILYLSSYKEDFISTRIEPIEGQVADEILETGDIIRSINNTEVETFADLSTELSQYAAEKITLLVLRDGQEHSFMPILNSEHPHLGIRPFISPIIQSVIPGRKAALYGFQSGDRIIAMQGNNIENAIDYFSILKHNTQKSIEFQIETAQSGEIKTHTIELMSNPYQEMGLRFSQDKKKKWESFPQFTQYVTALLNNTFTSTFRLFFQLLSFNTKDLRENTSGPIRIVSIIGNSTLESLRTNGLASALFHFIRITGIISLAVGIFNLLPIPVLDGGHILFHSVYRLRKKIPNYKAVVRYSNIGTILLLALFVLIVFNDVRNILQ